MTFVWDQIEGFPFFYFVTFISDMDRDNAGQDITEFFSLMRKIHISGTTGTQSQPDRFHDVFLGVRNDPFNGIVQFRIRFDEIVFCFENNLFLRRLIKKFIEAAAQNLQDICQSCNGRGGQIAFQL